MSRPERLKLQICGGVLTSSVPQQSLRSPCALKMNVPGWPRFGGGLSFLPRVICNYAVMSMPDCSVADAQVVPSCNQANLVELYEIFGRDRLPSGDEPSTR